MENQLYDKFIVIKKEDADKYLPQHDRIDLGHILRQIADGRTAEGKKTNSYFVVNHDEPYAELVKKLILGEVTAREIIDTIARNCVAWDTSKDKREGLLPEVAFYKNPYLYEKLTGEKYTKYGAINKFHIGED